MSVVVKNISKIYGEQKALDNISFEAKPGEILGLLGPNGAGKTTTMKILTCYLPPNEGTAEVNGYRIHDQSMDVRKSIGYLPEHNPLYPEMYIKEFLNTVASVYKLDNKTSRIKDIIELTGLTKEQHKPISALSKGYRQRVGLAQALLHDPEVLILDEPISGLDPNQLLEIRQLIKSLRETKTVIFSSHILQEVKALCDRVVILNNGKIVANGAIDQLTTMQAHKDVIRVEFAKSIDQGLLSSRLPKTDIDVLGKNTFEIKVNDGSDIREMLFDFAVEQQNKLLGLTKTVVSVEEVFQELTTDKSNKDV